MKSVKTQDTQRDRPATSDDPVLRMLGIGKELWEQEPGDRFVERLRAEEPPPSLILCRSSDPLGDLPETIWRRIKDHQGEQFRTSRGLPFTFELEGAGIWFFRDGQRINRKLSRAQVDQAIARCPLQSTTEIKDMMDYAYLFGLLTDSRIRGQSW